MVSLSLSEKEYDTCYVRVNISVSHHVSWTLNGAEYRSSLSFQIAIDTILQVKRIAITVNMLQFIQPKCEMSYLDPMITVKSLIMMHCSPMRPTHIV